MPRPGPRVLPWVLTIVALLSLCGCDGAKRESAASPSSVAPASAATVGPDHRFTITVGGQPVRMRLAVLEHERNRGLMQVPAMPEDEGMLFVFPAPQRMSFYMRNTLIPLDIGYFSGDGVLQEIYPMYPGIEDGVLSGSSSIQLALEMNQGWYLRHGVKPGSTIDLAAVRAALEQRGLPASLHFRAK